MQYVLQPVHTVESVTHWPEVSRRGGDENSGPHEEMWME
jgi:hypothetical protein